MKMLTKKLISAAALALFTAAPAFAASAFVVDFEKNWNYAIDVNGYYGGGTAGDATTGPNLGVTFLGVSGVSNDAPNFTYYSNAPSPLGTAAPYTFLETDKAYMNVAAGVDSALSFYYASPTAVTGAVKAYAGLNGTGALLGSFDLVANTDTSYSTWTAVTFNFAGTAQSFDLTASANAVGFDNISAVPEPETYALLLAGLGLVAGIARRNKRQAV